MSEGVPGLSQTRPEIRSRGRRVFPLPVTGAVRRIRTSLGGEDYIRTVRQLIKLCQALI